MAYSIFDNLDYNNTSTTMYVCDLILSPLKIAVNGQTSRAKILMKKFILLLRGFLRE